MTLPSRFLRIATIAALMFGAQYALRAADHESEIDLQQTLYAQRWMEAFRKLDARNNITMVLSNRDSLYELENVVEIEAYSRFLIVRTQVPNGISYRALVYPASIMLIKEAPHPSSAQKSGPARQ